MSLARTACVVDATATYPVRNAVVKFWAKFSYGWHKTVWYTLHTDATVSRPVLQERLKMVGDESQVISQVGFIL